MTFNLDIKNILLVIVGFINFVYGLIVYFRNRKSKTNFWFFLVVLAVGCWIISMFFCRGFQDQNLVLFWSKILYLSAALIPLFFLYFTFVFPEDEHSFKNWQKYLAPIPFLFMAAVSLKTGLLIKGVDIIAGGENFIIFNKPLHIIYGIYIVSYFNFGYFNLFKKYKNSQGIIRAQVAYVIVGTLTSTIIAVFTNLILLLFGNFSLNWLGQVMVIVMITSIFYSILKHHLFNIKVIATEILVAAISIFLAVRFLISDITQERIINGTLFILVVVFGIFLIKSVMREVSQREQLEKISKSLEETNIKLSTQTKYLQTLQDFTTSIIESLDFQNTIQSIVNGVSNRFGYLGAFLFLVSKSQDGEKIYPAAISQSAASSVALRILPKPLEEYFEFIGQTFSLTAEAIKTGEIKFSGDFSEIFSSIPKDILSQIQKTTGIRLTIVIPIKSKGKILGVLEVITAKTKTDISREELDVLKTLANQIGIVLDNASLFEETKQLSAYKTELLSIVAHQLKNPLVVVKGYSSLVEDNTIQGVDAMKEIFKKVKAAADKLIALLNNLLDLHHIEDGKMHYEFQKLELNKLLKDISDSFQLILAQRKLRFIFEPFAKDANVNGDIYKLSQVFQNLIDNAIKYTGTGAGWIKVKITDSQQPTTDNRQQMVNNSVNNHGAFLITVSDSGRGLSQDLIGKLFQKFSRGVEERQILGTGLGLYISKEIVEAHKGKIWAESEGQGKGSRFVVKLPKAE